MTTLADLDAMARTKKWGDKLRADLPSYPCPECGRMTRAKEAWVNPVHRAVLNFACESCPGVKGRGSMSVTYCWNLYTGSPMLKAVQKSLDDWAVGQ